MDSIIHHAKILINNGYQVIPVTTKDAKPLVSGFLKPTTVYNSRDVDDWRARFPDANLALVAGKNDVYAIDVDVDDERIANGIKRKILAKWDDVVVRNCNKPRFAILFRADDTLKEYSNAHSKVYKDSTGTINQIELMGRKTITVLGTHRKSGKPYKWIGKRSPLVKPSNELPKLSLSHVKKIFRLFENNVPSSYKLITRSTFSKPKRTDYDSFENARIKRKYSDEEIKSILNRATGDTYDTWREVGMGLHDHFDGNKKGLELWNKWSKKFKNYKGLEDCRRAWNSFHVGGGITLSSVERGLVIQPKVHKLNPEVELKNMIDNYVFIEKTNEVGMLDRPVNESLLSLQKAMNSKANVFIENKDSDLRKQTTRKVNVMKIWWTHPDRQTAHNIDYVPMKQRLIYPEYWNDASRTLTYYNAYEPPNVRLSPNTDLIHKFKEHINFIFPGNYKLVMNWFAQIVQRPWERHRVALYSICTHHGMGRGWIVDLTSLLFGVKNVSTIGSMDDIVRPNAKNGYLYRTVLLNVNEVSCRGDARYKISDRLKTLLSDNRQAIDLKWGEQNYGVEIFTRMFCQANAIGDMVIDEDDTRFTVCINHNKPKSSEYYVELYNLLNPEIHPDFVNQVYSYLMRWDVDVSLLQRAPMTKDKQTVIRANKTDTALAFYEFKMLMGDKIFTSSMLNNFMTKYTAYYHESNPNLNSLINVSQFEKLKKDQLVFNEMKKIGTRTIHLHSFESQHLNGLTDAKLKLMIKHSLTSVKKYFESISTSTKEEK